MGMPVHAVSMAEAVRRVSTGIRQRSGGVVLTANVDVLRQYSRSAFLRRAFEQADLVVTDGMPLVWALRLQATPVPQRITGTDLLAALSREAAGLGASVFLAGGRAGEAQRAGARLAATDPRLSFSSFPCFVEPSLPSAGQIADISAAVTAAAPDLVFVGLPFVHQVGLIDALRPGLPGTWFVGVGSSFELINGDRSRGPEWLQRIALEWAYRLTRQPHLWRRYLLHDLPFAGRIALAALSERVRPPKTRRHQRVGPGAST